MDELGAVLLAAAPLLLPATGALAANHPVRGHVTEMDDADSPGQADPAAHPIRGHRLERRGHRLQRRGRRLQRRGERIENRGHRRRGERIENRGKRVAARGRRHVRRGQRMSRVAASAMSGQFSCDIQSRSKSKRTAPLPVPPLGGPPPAGLLPSLRATAAPSLIASCSCCSTFA